MCIVAKTREKTQALLRAFLDCHFQSLKQVCKYAVYLGGAILGLASLYKMLASFTPINSFTP